MDVDSDDVVGGGGVDDVGVDVDVNVLCRGCFFMCTRAKYHLSVCV